MVAHSTVLCTVKKRAGSCYSSCSAPPLGQNVMHQNCDECTRLWNEYALATRHYLKLSGKLEIADSSNDPRSAQQLQPMVEQAASEREELRRQISQHEQKLRAGAAAAPFAFAKSPTTPMG